jgi:hypothetical protein
MNTLKQALEFAKKNPNDPRSTKLRESIEAGVFDQKAYEEGISIGRPVPKQTPDINALREEMFATLKKKDDETRGDIAETVQGIGGAIKGAGKDIFNTITNPDLNIAEKVVGAGSELIQGTGRAVMGVPLGGAIKMALPGSVEESGGQKLGEVGSKIQDTGAYKDVTYWYQNQSESTQRQIDNALGYGEGLLEFIGLKGSTGLTRKGLSKLDDYVKSLDGNVGNVGGTGNVIEATTGQVGVNAVSPSSSQAIGASIPQTQGVVAKSVRPPVFTPDDFTDPKLQETARVRMEAEANAPELTFSEKAAGMNRADKGVIIGYTDKMQEYVDVASTRNVTKNSPTIMEYGGDQVRDAAGEMEIQLNSTGNRIGQTRQKLATVKAPQDSVAIIDSTIKQQVDNLNLVLNDFGKLVQKPGAVSRVGTPADVNKLQQLLDEFKIVKQSPTLANLIDYRNLVQKNVDFSKSARETSKALDQPASAIRRAIKEEADKLVGASGAADLQEYSDFIEAYNEIKGFTDKKAGGEYLLRVLDSGRGGDARRVVNTIKKYTGIDLQVDATMLKLVTEMVADADQKTLFRQQITNAGLDTARILSGDTSSIIGKLGETLLDKITDPEKVLINATKKKVSTPNREGGFIKIGKDAPEVKSSPKSKESLNVSSSNNTTLLEEAKKYKSAEEFVDAQGIKVFHGSDKEFVEFDFERSGSSTGETPIFGLKGSWFVDNKDVAKGYGKFTKENVVDTSDFHVVDAQGSSLNDFRDEMWDAKKFVKDNDKKGLIIENLVDNKDFSDQTPGNHVFVLDEDVIKTKSQLTDIWNKANKQGGFVQFAPGQLTTKILTDLKGKSGVNKQYIKDALNREGVSKAEKDLMTEVLERFPEGKISADEFGKSVEAELLQLKVNTDKFSMGGEKKPRYQEVNLPSEVRGNVENYKENIYESPVKTSAGNTHFQGETENYFGHTRVEDVVGTKDRRLLEVQSDLFQKGNVQRELDSYTQSKYLEDFLPSKENKELELLQNKRLKYKEDNKGSLTGFSEKDTARISELEDMGEKLYKEAPKKREAEIAKLQQYENPTAHYRMIREEVKKAAQDGKENLLLPSGETAMKIEGLTNRAAIYWVRTR